MRFRHAVAKESCGRLQLHDLRSDYFVDVNEATARLIATELASPGSSDAGRRLVGRLAARGLIDAGDFEAIERRAASDVVSVEVEPIGRCNLTCSHCYVNFSGAAMTDATFAAVLNGACALGAVELVFNGGEPLLHPRCLAWIDAAAGAGLRVLLFTNATVVHATTAQRLAAAPVAKVTVSLDGFAATHDGVRGEGAFDRAVRGIRHLVTAGLAVHTTTMAHPGNQDELQALARYCRESLGVRGTRVSAVMALGRAAQRPELWLSPERLRVLYADERRASSSSSSSSSLSHDACASDHVGADAARTLPCRAGVDKLFISARGTVHACHLFDGVGSPLGTLDASDARGGLDTIYRQALASADASPLLRGFALHQLRACADCVELPQCRGGCRARAWQMTGDAFGPDPVECLKRGVTVPAPWRGAATTPLRPGRWQRTHQAAQ